MKQQRNINVLMSISLETSMTFTVCIQIFVVSSMFPKKIINESSLKEQWNMRDSEVNTSKTIKIKKFSIEIINVSNKSLRRIINESSIKQQGNINVSEISTKKLSIRFASKSSKNYQRFCIGSSTINQSSSKGISTF